MEEQIPNIEGSTVIVIERDKLHEIISSGSLEFDEWTSLISEIEKSCPNSLENICLIYDSFLSEFPLCYGYWRKYVNHIIRLSTTDKVVELFERAVSSATYCVDLWVDYCNFGTFFFEDPSDVRRLFKRAFSFVGKDYLSHALWDKFIEFEFSLKHWSSLAHIYIQTLRLPTKKLHHYYNSFKKLVDVWETEMQSCSNSSLTVVMEPMLDSEASARYSQDEIVCVIKDLLDPSMGSGRFEVLQKYKCIGEFYFKEASKLKETIDCFESCIKRPYFHVKPLDDSQLENWHQYLDFAELQEDFDWAVKLYERCLIPCANYPEFWMRYVEFVESKGGREIANFALDRSTQIFLKRVSVIHLFNARFKEHIGDAISARASFIQCNKESDSDFVQNVIMRSNMEKRLGNFTAASTIFKDAIEIAAKIEKWQIVPILYVHFSRLKYMTTNSEDAARDVLIDGIKHVPHNKLLIEELIKFAITHGGSRHINIIDTIVADAISSGTIASQGLSSEDGEDISRLYLEFVDLCGTVRDVRKAWNRYVKLIPQSVRTSLSHFTMGTKQWKIDMGEENLVGLPQPSGDSSSHCLIHSSLEEKKLSSPETNDTQTDLPAGDQFSNQKSPMLTNHDILPNQVPVQESSFLENDNELSDQVKVDVLQSQESENIVPESVCQASLKGSESSEDIIRPSNSLDLECQVANGTGNNLASLELSKENDVQKEFDQEPEQDLKPPSLERLSLDPQDVKSMGPLGPTSNDAGAHNNLSDGGLLKSEPPQRHNILNENMQESDQNANVDRSISSPSSSQATVSVHTNHGYVSPSSSAGNQNIMSQPFPQQQQLGLSGKSWHQKSHSDRFRRDSKFRHRGNSQRRLHKQRQSSPQQTCQRAEKGSQIPISQENQSQRRSLQNPHVQQGGQRHSQNPGSAVHTNLTAPQAWPTQNLQQQNLSSACYPQPPLYPQPQMSQNQMQGNEQYGHSQNNQAYNQVWQHYYYQQQQQQLLWQQQQLLQHQQPQQQQLLQQQYQQQWAQMQYLQQQQGQQLQPQQQQQFLLQQQQLQQLQHQQQGQLQQQQQQFLQQQSHLQLQQQQHYHQQQTPLRQQHPYEQEQGHLKQQGNVSQVQD